MYSFLIFVLNLEIGWDGLNDTPTRIISSFTCPFAEHFEFEKHAFQNKTFEPYGCIGCLGMYNVRFAQFVADWKPPKEVRCEVHKQTVAGVPLDAEIFLRWDHMHTAMSDCSWAFSLRENAEIATPKGVLSLHDAFIPESNDLAKFETSVMHCTQKTLSMV